MSKHLQALLGAVHSCVNSCFTGQLRVNFNSGGVCQPIYKRYRGTGIDPGFNGRLTVDGKTNKIIDIEEEICFNEK